METLRRQTERTLETLVGKKIGCVFHQHVSALAFWKALEREIEKTLKPARVIRIHKSNTWAPAPRADANRLLQETAKGIQAAHEFPRLLVAGNQLVSVK